MPSRLNSSALRIRIPLLFVLLSSVLPKPVLSFQILRMSSSSAAPLPPNDGNNIIELSHRSNGVPVPRTISLGGSGTNATALRVPTTLFLHGLDSSSQTWDRTLAKLLGDGCPGVAVDIRGNGRSDLGDPDEFSPDAIVEDLFHFVNGHPMFTGQSENEEEGGGGEQGTDGRLSPFVIVGHSMGGRIAMTFAAKYPQYVSALVIEDMDIQRRPMSMNIITSLTTRDQTVLFDRKIRSKTATTDTTEDDVIDAFKCQGYPKERVKDWLRGGRIKKYQSATGEYYYSEVNPAFRRLCYEQFFDSNHGEDTWNRLSKICGGNKDDSDEPHKSGTESFPCHVMVAGDEGTVCDEASICKMKDIFGRTFNLILHRYPNANHSIHNSDQKRYVSDLQEIIRTASLL